MFVDGSVCVCVCMYMCALTERSANESYFWNFKDVIKKVKIINGNEEDQNKQLHSCFKGDWTRVSLYGLKNVCA